MRKISKIIFTAFFFMAVPFSLVRGQDKKSEQKIKIIVDNGTGKKVVIDTIFYDSPKPDSIKLSDGTVIYMKNYGDEKDLKHHTGKRHILITASDDGTDNEKEFKEVTVISSDSIASHEPVYSRKKYKVITRDSDGQDEKEEVIYINKGKNAEKEIESTFDVNVSDNDKDTIIEKSRYVIAKDGMVVTVEGNDDARTKDLVKEIKSKLGINNENTEKKETVKAESKKIIKK